MARFTLYHLPPSFYSQIARIVLEEKGVAWESRFIVAGPPGFGTYAPWYMRLNPGGTVPTVVHGDDAIPDSLLIARYVDERFDGPALAPDEPTGRERMEIWIARLYDISIRELSYGGSRAQRPGRVVNGMRLAALRRRRRRNPGLADVYDAKIRDIEEFAERSLDTAHVASLRARLAETLDEMNRVLEKGEFLAGRQYTLADAIWTVGVARFVMLGLDPLAGRPTLARWYASARARPSFRSADVWERFHATAPLRVLAQRLASPLLTSRH